MVTIVSLSTQLAFEISKTANRTDPDTPDIPIVVGNFWTTFTYFTAALAAIVLLVSVIFLARKKQEPRWLKRLFLASAANTVFVGIFFNLALREAIPHDTINSEYLHVFLPIYMLSDALLNKSREVSPRSMWITAIPGVLWTIAVQIRGPFTVDSESGAQGWWPYDFINPHLVPGGLPAAIAVSLFLTGIIAVLGYFLACILYKHRSKNLRS